MNDEKIEKLAKEIRVRPGLINDCRIITDAENALQRTVAARALAARLSLWRTIMRNPITKLAAAACIIIAVVAGIYFITGKTPEVTCCAWAQIADKVAQIKTCVYRMHIQQSGGLFGQKGQAVESKIYISTNYGQKIETSLDGNVFQQVYVMADGNAEVLVMPSEKKYMRLVLIRDTQSKIKTQMQDPRDTITKFMTGPFKELGKDTINGIEVKGIEVNNPPAIRGVYNNFTGRTWVDVATEYPVRIEIETEIGTGADTTKMFMVMDEFEWGTELDPGIFEPNIPSDYKMMAEMKLPAQDEASAIEGLRVFAEMADGHYPSQMNVMTLTRESAEIFGKKFGEQKTKPTDEQTQQITAEMMKVQAPVLFYTKLAQDGNNPAYYGKDVNAGDADAVLMRWKTSDNTYRVIYGDLTAEDVNAEELKEMEQPANQ
jgi:hypothetical protein